MRYIRYKQFWILLFLFSAMTAGLNAGEIVPGLDDTTVLADYTDAYAGAESDTTDNTTGLLTLAARFSPDESLASGGPFIIIEIGGTTNGTGLYLGDGNLIFACKSANQSGLPESMNDTDFSDGAMAVTLGAIDLGVENEVYVSMDLNSGVLISSINGTAALHTINGSDGTENLDGNRSVAFLGDGDVTPGFMGGLVEDGEDEFPLLYWDNAENMTQTDGYSDQRGQVFADVVSTDILPYTILVSLSGSVVQVQEGDETDDVTVSLTNDPADYPVTITLSEIADSNQVQITPSELVFDTDHWQDAQVFTVTAVDDDLKESRIHTTTLQFQVETDSASEYFEYSLDDCSVEIQENDCEFWGYDPIDVNQDCQIDLDDLSELAAAWLECTLPRSGCLDYRP